MKQRAYTHLAFENKVKLVEWMKANKETINKKQLTLREAAALAMKTLDFAVSP